MDLQVGKVTDNEMALTNKVFLSLTDFRQLRTSAPPQGLPDNEVLVEVAWDGCPVGAWVFTASAHHETAARTLAMSTPQRNMAGLMLDLPVRVQPYHLPKGSALETLSFVVSPRKAPASGKHIELDCDAFVDEVKRKFNHQVFVHGQELVLRFKKVLYSLTVRDLQFANLSLGADEGGAGGAAAAADGGFGGFMGGGGRGQLLDMTLVLVEKKEGALIRLSNGPETRKPKTIFNKEFDFSKLGIGGLDTEFNQIFRRAFASRIFPTHIIEQLGIHHVRGMLLYGPPGCGKTLIARQIGKVLNAREPKIVNGPEILDRFVGGSEEKIRALFAEAEQEQKAEGDNSMLHIIIFDEFDAICKSRGSTNDNTGVSDSIVNQLLSKIDGVDSLNNILIIGMTNRKDMIDDAILRPGRLEVHVEIGLPNEGGRLQILNIHTANMRKSNPRRITDEAEARLGELAGATKNFSGAELSGLVRSAAACAMHRCVKTETMEVDENQVCVQWSDFEHALTEVHPKFGAPTEDLASCYLNGIVEYGPSFTEIATTLSRCVEQIRTSDRTPLLSVLLEGEPLTGKTAIAAQLAVLSEFPFVRMISADAMIGMGEHSKCAYIQKVFMDSYKSSLSFLILDDIERLINYTPIGPRFDNMVLQTLLVLLKKPPPVVGKRLFILGTSSCAHLLEDLQLVSAFNLSVNIPKLKDRGEVRAVLERIVPMSSDDLDAICSNVTEPLAVKQLLMIVEMARTEDDTVAVDRFAECLHIL